MKKRIQQISKITAWLVAGILIPGIFYAAPALSQTPCTEADAHQKIGSWGKQTQDFLVNADPGFPKEQYKPVLAKAQKAIELLKQANPQPIGIQASAYRDITGRSYTTNGALRFGVKAQYMNYLCMSNTPDDPERGQIVINSETSTVVRVYFNSLGSLSSNENRSLGKELTMVNGEIIYLSPRQTGELKGLSLLFIPDLDSCCRDEAIVITPDNRSPFKPVTREQFLQALENSHRRNIKKFQVKLQQSSTEDEKTIARMDSNNMLTAQQKADIKSGIAKRAMQLEKSVPQSIKIEEGEIANIESAIVRMSPTERQMQAVIVNQSDSLEKLFVSESEDGSSRLVTVDKSLFTPVLPRETIQFITVHWSWEPKDPAKAELIRQFKQNFDFEALRQMLGK